MRIARIRSARSGVRRRVIPYLGGVSFAAGAGVVRRLTDPTDRVNRVLVGALSAVVVAMSVVSLRDLLQVYPRGIDLQIPLQAAERWLAGGRPYLGEAFLPGAEVPPFLYPPYALVLFAPLTGIAETTVEILWFVASVALSFAACRRLGFPWWLIPLVLLWPPFTEAFVGGNIQTAIFAAFVFLLVELDRSSSERDVVPPAGAVRTVGRGLIGAVTAFLKVSQPHAIVYLIRREPVVAVVAVGAIVLLAVATLPLTGIALWSAWLDQLARASDPGWTIGGSSVAKLLPAGLSTAFIAGCLAAALIVPRRMAAEWIGVLLVLGSPGLRTYYLLFLIPAMLRIRREIALVAAFCLATYTQEGWWLGIAIVVGALAVTTIYERLNRRADAPAF